MLDDLLGRLFPSRCHACGEELRFGSLSAGRLPLLCDRCRDRLRPSPDRENLARGFPLLAAFEAEEILIGLVKAWKFASDDAPAGFLAGAMAGRLAGARWPRPWNLVPIPLAPLRSLRRGFNQSGILAEEIARNLGLSRPRRLLSRRLFSGRQAGRDRRERRLLVSGEFRGRTGIPPDGTLILVDDLCTTGSTLLACRDALGPAARARCAALVAGRVPDRSRIDP